MFRRALLRALTGLSVLPLVPRSVTPDPPELPASGNLMFWYHFWQAIEHGSMSSAQSRETVVEDLDFEHVSEQEAKRALKLASAGYYDPDDVPREWREYFNQVEHSVRRDE